MEREQGFWQRPPSVWLASLFGIGFIPKASGTFGSLASLPLIYASLEYLGSLYTFFLFFFIFGFSVWLSHLAGQELGEADHSAIVIDELAGQWVACLLCQSWVEIGFCFLLFRFFDITKIYPANFFDQKVKNGFGVTMDDVISGVYALGFFVIAKRLGL